MTTDHTAVREWTPDEIRVFGYRVVDIIVRHLCGLRDRPVFQPVPADLQQQFLNGPLSDEGCPAADVLTEFEQHIEPYPFGNGHPRFFGWVNSPPTVIGIFADALAAAMNPSCAGGNHAAVFVEREVIRWFRRVCHFPESSMGLLVSGGSMASLTALTVARHVKAPFNVRAQGLQDSHAPLVIYKTREGHSCIQKAVELLGLGSDNIRIVAHDQAMRMVPSALEASIDIDRAAGRVPMAAVTSVGTVNTGAIDPIDEIADVCQRHNVWLHVDGAYGALAVLSARYRAQLSSLGRCDSLALDPHKWLYVPVEAGLVLIRDADGMRETFSLVPPYLRAATSIGGLPWFSEYGFQQTRSFRALKVWMALKHHGVSGYRVAIDHDLSMAARLAEGVRRAPALELLAPQSLTVVCFRYVPPGPPLTTNAINEINQAVLERLQLGGRAFLSSTLLDGVFWLRACIINYRTTIEDIDVLPDLVATLGAEVTSDLAH